MINWYWYLNTIDHYSLKIEQLKLLENLFIEKKTIQIKSKLFINSLKQLKYFENYCMDNDSINI